MMCTPAYARAARRRAALVWLAMPAVAVPAGAQGPTATHPVATEQLTATRGTAPRSLPNTPAMARLASITTGDFRRGHAAVGAYPAPGLCVAAARVETTLALRSIAARAADTARWTAADTLPHAAVALARACAARFTVTATPDAELADLFALRLLAMDDAGAAVVAAKWLALAPTTAARLRVLRETQLGYLYAKPARVAAAESAAVAVDRAFPAEPLARLLAHGTLLAYADSSGDLALMRRTADRMLAAWRPVPDSEVEVTRFTRYDIVAPYRYLMEAALLGPDPAEVSRTLQRARAELGRRMPSPSSGFPPRPNVALAGYNDTAPGLLIDGEVWAYAKRAAAVPLRPARWVAPDPRDTLAPAPGVVSLIVRIGPECLYNGWFPETCESSVNAIKRLHARYGGAGLTITLQSPITGYSVPRGIGKQPATEEAQDQWTYYHDTLGLPIRALALDSVSSHWLPAPDGRRVSVGPAAGAGVTWTLVGRDGRVWYQTPGLWTKITPQFLMLLDRALREGAAAPVTR